MILLGIDVGTSSIKVSAVDASTGKIVGASSYPPVESEIISLKNGWAEQSPEMWWSHVQNAISICQQQHQYNPADVAAIGIAYQMHGLVMVDKDQRSLRNSIIWCDSRAVEIGEEAATALGEACVQERLLNSPGNFTAAKLAWVKRNEPELYAKIDKVMLPGDFIAMKLTGEVTTSNSALSEGIFWDFEKNGLSDDIMNYFGFDHSMIPQVRPVFSSHGTLLKSIADLLGLKPGIPVTYKSGDQPNNALSLNVTQPGEVAATAGTSGVIYGITDQLVCDKGSRVNTFAHVNHTTAQQRLGVLLCINGTGSMNRWIKNTFGNAISYEQMNQAAANIPAGSNGLRILPFGNGAERMLNNRLIGAHFLNLDLNQHAASHVYRAVQEGIAFAFRYGLDILRESGMEPEIIRAGRANLFLSEVFTQSFVNITGVPVELYENDSSYGAAIGAGLGAGIFKSVEEAFVNRKPMKLIEPDGTNLEEHYQDWRKLLVHTLKTNHN